jgi:hypothetical protein
MAKITNWGSSATASGIESSGAPITNGTIANVRTKR